MYVCTYDKFNEPIYNCNSFLYSMHNSLQRYNLCNVVPFGNLHVHRSSLICSPNHYKCDKDACTS